MAPARPDHSQLTGNFACGRHTTSRGKHFAPTHRPTNPRSVWRNTNAIKRDKEVKNGSGTNEPQAINGEANEMRAR